MASDAAPSDGPRKPVTPRDAASLVLIRDGADGPEVLMGRRPRTARFMPGVYVFPGGAVEDADFSLDSDCRLADPVLARVGRKATPTLARALAWTALRETWEETGLLVGVAGVVRGAAECAAVRAFTAAGLAPDLASLDYLMRAVTPPYVPIRFNTRFFIADGNAAQGMLQPCPELEEVGWHLIEAALDLPIVNVTEIVLDTAQRYWSQRPSPDADRPTLMFTQASPGEIVLEEE